MIRHMGRGKIPQAVLVPIRNERKPRHKLLLEYCQQKPAPPILTIVAKSDRFCRALVTVEEGPASGSSDFSLFVFRFLDVAYQAELPCLAEPGIPEALVTISMFRNDVDDTVGATRQVVGAAVKGTLVDVCGISRTPGNG